MRNSEFKKYMMKGLDFCFDKLYETLSPISYYYNDIIHLKLRYTRIENESNKGITDNEYKDRELNRIQKALLEYIDKLEDEDFVDITIAIKSQTGKVESHYKHFWQPFFNTRTTVVIGTYYSDKFRAWEASTLMGTGDGIALGKIIGTLNKVGVKDIEVVPTYNFAGDRYQDNLILIGGPDANILTREVFERLSLKFGFGDPDKHEISLYDNYQHKTYLPKYNSNKRVIGDYGLVFKTQNPFNPETCVIILAGCFGFGTCASAQLFEIEKLLETIEGFEDEEGFEALVYSDVINDWTQKPRIIQSYKIKVS